MDLPDDTRSGLLADVPRGDNSPPVSVSELSGALKRMVEASFDKVRVRGEISGFKRHASGHCYFTLKDEGACLDAVIWRGQAAALAFRPEDGAEVIATGKLTTYPGRSKYQLVVNQLELAGEGALMALLDRRRRALAEQGLFDPERKRALPYLPKVIGVVTSPTGAVIRDILHRLEDRCPTRVIVWPVPVQGEGAATRIAAAIQGFGALDGKGGVPRPDLLIVARGGGSIEDLWAFNEEEVVRAVAECSIPIISAVGHETDTTLIDHAADMRAPTPTAAAELAVPILTDLLTQLAQLAHRTQACLARALHRGKERFDLTRDRWPQPRQLFASAAQRCDELAERLPRALAARSGHARADLNAVAPRLRHDIILQRIRSSADQLSSLWRLATLAHPDRPLERGFARVTNRAGQTVMNAARAREEQALKLRFGDGEVDVSVGTPAARTVRKRVEGGPAGAYLGRQAGLFDQDEE